MAGKEALAFVIDVRQPMGTRTGADETTTSTRLSAAVRGVEAMVTAKMMQSKQTEAIIVLAGTDDTNNHLNQNEMDAEDVADPGYQNVSTIGIFERPTIRTLRELRDVSEPGGVTDMGVLVSGLLVAYDALNKRVGKLKFVKRRARGARAASLAPFVSALIISPTPRVRIPLPATASCL